MTTPSFIRAARRIVVVSGLAVACTRPSGPAGTDNPPTLGTLTINVAGLTRAAATGGSAFVTRTDIGGQPALTLGILNEGSVASSVVVKVAPGTYNVTYAPPIGYSAAEGAGFVQQIEITTGSLTAFVNFDVVFRGTAAPVTGLLGIVADFLTSPYPANGGSASIIRTDTAGQSAFTLDIPDEYTEGYFAVAAVPIGTYTITYSPPSGYTVPPGYSTVQTAVVDGETFTVWVTFSAVYAPARQAISVVPPIPSAAATGRNAGRRGGRRTSDP